MKNLFLSLTFLCATASVFASPVSNHTTKTYKLVDGKLVECTVTATVSIPGGTGVTISSTQPTCAQAVADVANGVKAIKNQF
jgi:hypothetical protein